MSEIEKLDLKSMNISEEKKTQLRSIFPEVFTDGNKIDFNLLKLTLGDMVDVGKERYGMNWPGKADCFKTIQQSSVATLLPCKDESVDFETTQNIFIEGDNLEILKLLQRSYPRKIKMIYIDPPYNTGNDFIYPDNYSESLDTYLSYTGQVDGEGKRLSTNTETDGRFHSKWMNMMYPRLFLAKNLLMDEGVIFISIDDHEMDNLRKICNEVFGEENYVANIVWERAYSPVNLKKHFSESHDYILCYAKSIDNLSSNGLKRSEEAISRYSNPDNDPRGPWTSSDLSVGPIVEDKVYEIITPTGRIVLPPSGYCWRYSKERFEEMVKDNRIWFGEEKNNVPRIKRFLSEVKNSVTPMTIWKYSEVGHSQGAQQKLKQLFGGNAYFNYPKSTELIKRMLELYTDSDSIILDFFAGSCTTAHAVLEFNKEDGGNRQFICVQLPELTNSSSAAFKAGYKTVADIGKERIRLAINQIIKQEEDKPDIFKKDLDLGFRVFKLQRSCFNIWDSQVSKDIYSINSQLELNINHINADRTQEDILYEILLKSGFELTTSIDTLCLADKRVFSIAEGAMIICLENEVTIELIKAIVAKSPSRVVCLDMGFKDNDQLKTNAVQIMKVKDIQFRTV